MSSPVVPGREIDQSRSGIRRWLNHSRAEQLDSSSVFSFRLRPSSCPCYPKFMRLNLPPKSILVAAALVGTAVFSWGAEIEEGFTSLFNGKTLDGWTLVGKHGDGYGVKDGVLYCAKGGG